MKNNTSVTRILHIFILTFFFHFGLFAQVGIGTTAPSNTLDVETNAVVGGIEINNTAANGDPILQYQVNGASRITMGIDDSDADKFKIGTTALTTNTRLTIETGGNIGVNTTTPANMLQMTNGGFTVGANAMASFDNSGPSGVSLSGYNSSATSGYNGIEGITNYNGTGFIPAGVFGLAINTSLTHVAIGVRGTANGRDGVGVYGSRQNTGGVLGWGGVFYNDLGYTGFFGAVSDERTKKDILKIENAINIISQLNPVTYNFDLEKYPNMGLNEEMEYGFIAQEVREIIPEITRIKKLDANATLEIKSQQQIENKSESFVVIDYTRIIPILTKGMQEQQKIIENQNVKISTLENKLAVLETRINALIDTQN